jgi:hypothetical protein
MSDPARGLRGERTLPVHPNLDHLKSEAKERLKAMRLATPDCRLAEAQFQMARDYGFPSWRALKAHVDRRAGPNPFARYVGAYRHDPAVISNGVMVFIEHAGRLFIENGQGSKLELADLGDGSFSQPGLLRTFHFVGPDDQPAAAVVIRTDQGSVRLERTDAATASLAREAVKRAIADQARPREAIPVAPESLEAFVGHYSTRLGPAIEITLDGARLFACVTGQVRLEIFAETETRFFYRQVQAQLAFVLEAGRAVAVVLHQNGQEQHLPRVSAEEAQRAGAVIAMKAQEQQRPHIPIKIDPATLAGYAGRYGLGPLRTITVTAEGDRLFVQVTDQPRFEVYPESAHRFFWTVAAAQITFITDKAGYAVSAVMHQAGRDIPIARVEAVADEHERASA